MTLILVITSFEMKANTFVSDIKRNNIVCNSNILSIKLDATITANLHSKLSGSGQLDALLTAHSKSSTFVCVGAACDRWLKTG